MIRSLTIKFVLLVGTLGLIMALSWPVPDRGVERKRIVELPSVAAPLAVGSNSTASVNEGENTVTLPRLPTLLDSTNHHPNSEVIDLNLSTTQELEALPGIGPILAKRIIDYRMQVGDFQSIQALDNVKGIGKKKLQALSPLLKISPISGPRKSQG